MKLFLLVCLGGALGSGLRYGTQVAYERAAPEFASAFPWATLTVNVVGCLAIGLGYGWLSRGEFGYADEIKALLLVGFCGGLTTFSSFAGQTLALPPGKAIANVAASVACSLGATWLGLFISGAK